MSTVMLFIAILFNVIAQLLLKLSAKSADSVEVSAKLTEKLTSVITNPVLIAAVASYFLAFVTYFLALSKIELSKAYPAVSVSVILATTIISGLFLGESVSVTKIIGIVICTVGIFLIFLK